jgi:hypothetical protein
MVPLLREEGKAAGEGCWREGGERVYREEGWDGRGGGAGRSLITVRSNLRANAMAPLRPRAITLMM